MGSWRSPVFPKMVIFTSSSKLASLSLKSVAFYASTVNIFWFPAAFENVMPLSNRVTSLGAGGGAFSFSRCATHLRSRYTPAVRLASNNAVAADQRAYFAASLRFMSSVKQNFAGVYRRGNARSEVRYRRRGLPGGFSGRHARQYPDIRRCHAVALGIFHQVHGFVGEVQQAFLGPRIHRVRCNTYTGRQL